MNAEQFNSLLQNPSELSTAHLHELNLLTEQYPWFGAAQFLSAIQQQKENIPSAETQIQKAFLYFNNPVWMNFQLNRFLNEEETIIVADEMPAAETQSIQKEETEMVLDAEATIAALEMQDAVALNEPTAHDTEAAMNAAVVVEAAELHEETNTQIASIANILKEPLPQNQTTELSLQAFHTVDYFASQGIRLKEEKTGTDQLSTQLKTFTQWLKTMKKSYVEEHQQLDATEEKKMEQIATSSNAPEEIVTESMASVLEQQGKTQKAIELYRKLSLLHPEKSAYFATQIERLNK
ncbi:MAG: hypothetical protein K2X48_03210 [Chitinophagaceae bacterium]|nr:hypothetical protein [Chitinophagaceae bacterium]